MTRGNGWSWLRGRAPREETLTPDMESCVAAEFVLAKLTVEYMHTKQVCHDMLAYAHQVICCTLDSIKKSTATFAAHCRDLFARNKVNESIDQHSDDSTVLDNFMSKRTAPLSSQIWRHSAWRLRCS